MAARYSRLPTDDDYVSVDIYSDSLLTHGPKKDKYESYYTYGKMNSKYRSHFTYDGVSPHNSDENFEIVRAQSTLSSICHYLVISLTILLVVVTFPFSLIFCLKIIRDHERLAIFRLGRLQSVKGPGLVVVLPCIDRSVRVDIRVKAFNVPPQQLITADRAIIEVGADVQYQNKDVTKSILSIENPKQSLRVLVQASLTNHLLTKTGPEIESDKFRIILMVQEDCNRTANNWGIEITRIELPPIKLLKAAEPPPQGAAPNLMMPPGLPQTFQQLTSVFMQAAASAGQQADGQTMDTAIPDAVTVIPSEDGAVGSGDVLPDDAPTPKDILAQVNMLLTEAMVRSVGAVYMFELSGEHGGLFYLDLKNGHGHAGEGVPPGGEPEVTLTLSVTDMQRMFMDKLKPMPAYMSGRLKVSGDLSAALQLEDIIKTVMKKLKVAKSGVQSV